MSNKNRLSGVSWLVLGALAVLIACIALYWRVRWAVYFERFPHAAWWTFFFS